MTVSRVINHPQLVTEELRDLVYRAMDELDYRPNTAAKALALNRTMLVKVLVLEEMDITEPYYMHLLNGISQELNKYQYALQLLTENALDTGRSDGYIITGMKEGDYEWIVNIDKPHILFGENKYGVPFVDSDNKAGLYKSTEYAIQQDYQHIIFVGLDVPEQFEKSREQGYLQAIADHSGYDSQLIRILNSSQQAEKLIVEELAIKDNTCFVCGSDRIAIGIVRGLSRIGKNIPNQVGVIGFDGVFLDQISSPKLTTVKQDVVEMGRVLVRQLMKLIGDEELNQPSLFHDTELIIRDTTR